MFMPWIFLLPASVFGAWKMRAPKGPQRRLLIFSLCWFLFPFLFFSASKGKLITYILPCMPPLCILFAYGLHWWIDKSGNRFLQWGIGALLAAASLALVTLAGLQLFGPEHLHLFQQSWKWVMLSSGIAAMILLLLVAFRINTVQQKVTLFALSFATLLFTAHFTIPDQTLDKTAPGLLIKAQARHIKPDTIILSGTETIRAVCWYLQRDDVYLIEHGGELNNGLSYKDSADKEIMIRDDILLFIKNHRGRVMLFTESDEYQFWRLAQPLLPQPVSFETSEGGNFLVLYY
jgi:4-amino-4-deoxy-L-arabinose transferase